MTRIVVNKTAASLCSGLRNLRDDGFVDVCGALRINPNPSVHLLPLHLVPISSTKTQIWCRNSCSVLRLRQLRPPHDPQRMRMDGWMDHGSWMDGWKDEWIKDGWMDDGLIDGWMD